MPLTIAQSRAVERLNAEFDGPIPPHLMDAALGRVRHEITKDERDYWHAMACARLQRDKAKGEIGFARLTRKHGGMLGDFDSRRRKARFYLESWRGYLRIARSIKRRLDRGTRSIKDAVEV